MLFPCILVSVCHGMPWIVVAECFGLLWQNALDCCGRCLGGFTVICYYVCCSGLLLESGDRGELQTWGWFVVIYRLTEPRQRCLSSSQECLPLRRPCTHMVALIHYYYYHCCYYYYCSFIYLKAEAVTFVELTVDTSTGFVSAKEVFVPGVYSYEAHPCFKSLAFFLTPCRQNQLFPLLNAAFLQSIFALALPSLWKQVLKA